MNVEISPANKSLIELTSQIYEDSELMDIINLSTSLYELNDMYPAECIREFGNSYRISYRGVEKIAVVFFDCYGEKLMANIYNTTRYAYDFKTLAVGQALEYVQSVDPQGEYPFLYTGRNDTPMISSHYTKDGYIILIEYNNSMEIIKITKELV